MLHLPDCPKWLLQDCQRKLVVYNEFLIAKHRLNGSNELSAIELAKALVNFNDERYDAPQRFYLKNMKVFEAFLSHVQQVVRQKANVEQQVKAFEKTVYDINKRLKGLSYIKGPNGWIQKDPETLQEILFGESKLPESTIKLAKAVEEPALGGGIHSLFFMQPELPSDDTSSNDNNESINDLIPESIRTTCVLGSDDRKHLKIVIKSLCEVSA